MHNDSPLKDQIKLLKYLDEFDKQISSRRNTPNNGLEEQLASLSRAYNQAQEKLLDTEKALMAQSVLLEKQRSVIDIYKCALNEQLDEQGLLFFLQQLQQDESNRQIYDDIAQVRSIVTRRKMQSNKKSIQEERVQQLKKEIARISQNNSVIVEENQRMNSTFYEVHMNNQQIKEELDKAKQDIMQKDRQIQRLNRALEEERNHNQKMNMQINANNRVIQQMATREKQMKRMCQKAEELQSILKEKLGFTWGQVSTQNSSTHINKNNHIGPTLKPRQSLEDLSSKLAQLIKYKSQYKRLKQNNTNNDFLKKEISLLKLYLSQEALALFKQFQLQRQDCIQTQLRNLALLERSRLIRLEECEKDVWKYRIQLMLEDQGTAINNNNSKNVSRAIKSKPGNYHLEETSLTCQERPIAIQQGSANVSEFESQA